MPFHKELLYAGLGLADLAIEGATRVSSKLRLLEKELVARGQKRSGPLSQQFNDARQELNRRGDELQQGFHRGLQEMWSALRGRNAGEHAQPATGTGS